jgi:hypothetical protein
VRLYLYLPRISLNIYKSWQSAVEVVFLVYKTMNVRYMYEVNEGSISKLSCDIVFAGM